MELHLPEVRGLIKALVLYSPSSSRTNLYSNPKPTSMENGLMPITNPLSKFTVSQSTSGEHLTPCMLHEYSFFPPTPPSSTVGPLSNSLSTSSFPDRFYHFRQSNPSRNRSSPRHGSERNSSCYRICIRRSKRLGQNYWKIKTRSFNQALPIVTSQF